MRFIFFLLFLTTVVGLILLFFKIKSQGGHYRRDNYFKRYWLKREKYYFHSGNDSRRNNCSKRYSYSASEDSDDEIFPFYAKKLMFPSEQVLYYRLFNALPEYIVFAQVQLSQLVVVKHGYDKMYWFNRINRMSADFVVCRRDSSVVAVVELDDSTHDLPKRIEADLKKDKALASAGIRLIRWRSMPDTEMGDRKDSFVNE